MLVLVLIKVIVIEMLIFVLFPKYINIWTTVFLIITLIYLPFFKLYLFIYSFVFTHMHHVLTWSEAIVRCLLLLWS